MLVVSNISISFIMFSVTGSPFLCWSDLNLYLTRIMSRSLTGQVLGWRGCLDGGKAVEECMCACALFSNKNSNSQEDCLGLARRSYRI